MTTNEQMAYVLLTKCKALILILGDIVVGDIDRPFEWTKELSAEFTSVCNSIDEFTTQIIQ